MKLHELRADKADLLAVAQSIVTTAKAANKDLESSQLQQYNTVLAQIKELDEKIERCVSVTSEGRINPPFPLGGNLQSEGWTNQQTGQPIAVLSREQRMSSFVDNMGEPS